MEEAALAYFARLDAMGGMVNAIEQGFPQREIAESSYAYQRAVEAREKIIVGVNDYVVDEQPQEILYIGEEVRESQISQVAQVASDALERGSAARHGCTLPHAGRRAKGRAERHIHCQYHAAHSRLRARLRYGG